MSGPPGDRHLTYAQVVERIHAVLGVRPALSTLRAAGADRARGTPRTRVTAGMPAPLNHAVGRGQHGVFDAEEIETWLAHHPRVVIDHEQQQLRAASIDERPAAVARARAAGLSWQQVAAALTRADGASYTRQWAQQRFGTPPSDPGTSPQRT